MRSIIVEYMDGDIDWMEMEGGMQGETLDFSGMENVCYAWDITGYDGTAHGFVAGLVEGDHECDRYMAFAAKDDGRNPFKSIMEQESE